MKISFYSLGLVLAFNLSATAAISYSYSSTSATIPDNNKLGTADSLTCLVSGGGSAMTDLTLSFTLQGGAATDLSGYLRLGNTAGSPAYDLTSLTHSQTLSAGSPTTYAIDFTTAAFQTAFNGLNPNDTWTLFFADTVPGDQTTLNGWSLGITAVPEPANMALAVFGVLFVGVGSFRWFGRQRQLSSH